MFVFAVYVKGHKTWSLSMSNGKQSHYRPGQDLAFQEVEAPRYHDRQHMYVVRLSAIFLMLCSGS
jgi:hypothetical protein